MKKDKVIRASRKDNNRKSYVEDVGGWCPYIDNAERFTKDEAEDKIKKSGWNKLDYEFEIILAPEFEEIPVPVEDKFGNIFKSLNNLMDYKNEKYGNAALEPLNIFQGKTSLGQRLDDKVARVKNSDTLRKNDVGDLIGYLVLVCKEKGWENFDEFQD